MPEPTFSVITPAHDAAGTIDATIRSVLRQTPSDLELIVVDDASTDTTTDLVEAHARRDRRVQLVRLTENVGTAAARNAGLTRARGRYVSFLDHDDAWLPGFLEGVAGALEHRPEAGLAFADAWIADGAGGRVHPWTALRFIPKRVLAAGSDPDPARALAALLRVNFITTCAATISRPALDRVGGLDPSLRGSDDWDLWLRTLAAGFRAVALPAPLAVLRKHPASQGADQALMAVGARLALQRALERGLPSDRARREAERHLSVVEGEIGARERGSRAATIWWKLRRHLGRRRLRPLRLAGWREPPPEVREALGVGR